MKRCRIWQWLGGRLIWLALAALLPLPTVGRVEETFETLQIGTKVYRNVTVTTKAKDYIFILHTAGMVNLKVTDLPPDLRNQLGYVDKPKPQNRVGAWARRELARLDIPQVSRLRQTVRASLWSAGPVTASIPPWGWLSLLGAVLAAYLFFCCCCAMICRKTGNPPGLLIWLPVLQMFPLLRAAGMSPWWFVAWLLPVLNFLAQIVWSIKIVQARAKNAWFALLLLLPGTNLFTFLYLAFSGVPRTKEPVVEIMTLDAA